MSKRRYVNDENAPIDPAIYETEKKPFSKILYDKKEGTVLGRNSKSWGKKPFKKILEVKLYRSIKLVR